ncbi:MAG: hypothetical protein AAGA56_23555, partial [Myxococcota bacterium]
MIRLSLLAALGAFTLTPALSSSTSPDPPALRAVVERRETRPPRPSPPGRARQATPTVQAPPPTLISTARETWIYAEPRWRARRLGYLRAGA